MLSPTSKSFSNLRMDSLSFQLKRTSAGDFLLSVSFFLYQGSTLKCSSVPFKVTLSLLIFLMVFFWFCLIVWLCTWHWTDPLFSPVHLQNPSCITLDPICGNYLWDPIVSADLYDSLAYICLIYKDSVWFTVQPGVVYMYMLDRIVWYYWVTG